MGDNDFFYKEAEEAPVKKRKPVKAALDVHTDNLVATKVTDVPKGYIKVKLSSVGKLSAPSVIHVRDYSGENAWNLSLSNSDSIIESIALALDDMIFENVNPLLFHESEVEEILLNVLLNFWTPILSEYPFPWQEDDLKDLPLDRQLNIREEREIPRVDINISKLDTKPLPKKFKEPVIWEDESMKVGFVLPRMGHYLDASNYVAEKYAEDEQRFSQIEDDIRYNNALKENDPRPKRVINPDYMKEYRTYVKNKNSDYLKIKQAMMICSFNDELMESVDDRLEVYSLIGLHVWSDLSSVMEDDIDFGIVKDIEVVSPLTHTKVIRRFQFRFQDVVPNTKLKSNRGSNIRFGD